MIQVLQKSRVPALNRCLTILELLQQKPHSVSEVVSQTGMPRSTVYVVVDEMIRQGLIRQKSDGRLQLWMRLVEFGDSALQSFEIRDKVEPHIVALQKSISGVGVFYGEFEAGKGWCVMKKLPTGPMPPEFEGMNVGPLPLGTSALGKCLMAYQPDRVQRRLIDRLDFENPLTVKSITSVEGMISELENIRNRGFAVNNEEWRLGVVAVAAPVTDHDGALSGAVSVASTSAFFADGERLDLVVEKVRNCALSINLGL